MMKSQCIETARLCGMGHRKGKLEPGYDADIVIWDPEAKLKVCPIFVLTVGMWGRRCKNIKGGVVYRSTLALA